MKLEPGEVYVSCLTNGFSAWKKAKEEDVAPVDIAVCGVAGCDENAVELDVYFPYEDEDNRCEKHKREKR